MGAKRSKRRASATPGGESVERREIHGYVAVRRVVDGVGVGGWVYLRRHGDGELFVGNVGGGEDVVRGMVPGASGVKVVAGGKGAVVAGVDVAGVLQRPGEFLFLEREEQRECVVERWIEEYAAERVEEKVREWSSAVVRAFEGRERAREEAKALAAEKGRVKDEDGFMVVTTGPKRMVASEAAKLGVGGRKGTGNYKSRSARNRKTMLDLQKGIEKNGFYRWQKRDKDQLNDLRDRFQEDRKRVAAIRSLRGPMQ